MGQFVICLLYTSIRRDFYGESSVSGTPFIGDFCSTDSGSMIIYAHNMKNGTLFGELDEYESEDYRNKHSVLEFYTPDESRQYEIFAAFRTELVYENQEGFRYYEYVGDMTEEMCIRDSLIPADFTFRKSERPATNTRFPLTE